MSALFSRLIQRVQVRCEERAKARAAALADALAAELPAGIAAEADEAGVRLGGRALKRRLALDPALRWSIMELAR